jgi:nitrogen-specific signal transduction histidine kinase
MTTLATTCLLLTCDPELTRRLAWAVGGLAEIRVTASLQDWTGGQNVPALRLLDLRHPDSENALAGIGSAARSAVVAFGVPESEPFVACRGAGVFAVEALDAPAEQARQTLRQAVLLHQALEEVNLLRQQEAEEPPAGSGPSCADEPDLNLAPLYELWRASRHFRDIQKLMDQLVEGIAAVGRIVRVGVFARLHGEASYRLWAGLRCLNPAGSITYGPHDPFVRWLERHAHLVCRSHLAHVGDLRDRRLLQGVLDDAGAEIIVPLLGKRGLLGWIFVGHRATGVPFAPRDLTNFTVLGEQVATMIENALLVEELAVQKTLAENLLEALPVGILAVSGEGVIRWFNRAAEQILGVSAGETVNQPVERAGSRVADVVLRAIRDGGAPSPAVWTDPASRRTVRADVHPVGGPGACLGAMLLLSDISHERLLREKQEELERHAFWSDLAAAMSHEVRNPLVAISTFAQLLPERYTDPEFRQQFFDVVTGEVARLNAIITQINAFAHPRKPEFRPNAPEEVIAQACARAAERCGDKNAAVCEIEKNLPAFEGDADALADGLAHVLINAYEAAAQMPSPRVKLLVRCAGAGDGRTLVFAVSDNGPGIDSEVREKLFSPFSTTKSRGLGLGLPLARRAVVDHGGRIDVDSSENGTTVTLTFPLKGGTDHAEDPDR